MSFLPSDMNEVLQMCRTMISCVVCKKIYSSVLRRACSHIVCDGCSELHSCSAPSTPAHSGAHEPPSLAFLKGLYHQLTRISSINQKSCFAEKPEEADTKNLRKHLKRSGSTRKISSPPETPKRMGTPAVELTKKDLTQEFFIPSISHLNKKIDLNKKNNVTLEFADLDDLVTRYLPNKPVMCPTQIKIETSEMPMLERQDFKECSESPLSSNENPYETQFFSPDILVASDNANHSRNSNNSVVEVNESTDDESIKTTLNGLQREVGRESRFSKRNKFKRKTKVKSGKISKKIGESRVEDAATVSESGGEESSEAVVTLATDAPSTSRPRPSTSSRSNTRSSKTFKRNKNTRRVSNKAHTKSLQDVDFAGFREFEIDYGLIKHLHFKMIVNKSTCETGNTGDLEVTVKRREVPSPETSQPSSSSESEVRIGVENTAAGLVTPRQAPEIREISPVEAEERERADVSRVFDDSIIDLAALSSSTPAQRHQLHSKRRLSYLQNGRANSTSPVEEEGDLQSHFSPIIRKKKRVERTEDRSSSADSDLGWRAGAVSLNGDIEENEPVRNTMGSGVLDSSGNVSASTTSGSPQPPPQTNGYPQHSSASTPQTTPETSLAQGMQKQLDDLIFKEEKESNPEKNDEVIVSFATCGLSFQEQRLVAKLARLTNSRLRNCFSHETTHLIINKDTIAGHEYLFAIVYRVTIVNFDWVNVCLKEEKILSPSGFIPGEEEGPCRCLESSEKPFCGFYFFMGMSPHPSHLDYDTYQVTKTLCYNGGAHIITDHEGFLPFVQVADLSPRFYICFTTDLVEIISECSVKLKAVPIKHTWVLQSIRQYRALPIQEFLYRPLDTPSLNFYRIPDRLRSHDT